VDLVAGWLLASLVIDGSLGGVGPLVGSSLGSLVDIGLSFGATHVGLYCWRQVGRGGGCSIVVVIRVVVVAAVVVVAVFFLVATCWHWVGRGGGCSIVVVVRVVVVAAVVVVTVFFLVATCCFKDTSWISLFEVGKMREKGP